MEFKHSRSCLTHLADEADVKKGKVLGYSPTKIKSKAIVEPRVSAATVLGDGSRWLIFTKDITVSNKDISNI